MCIPKVRNALILTCYPNRTDARPALVITKQPKELMDKWLGQIPGGRTCQPPELKGVRKITPLTFLHF